MTALYLLLALAALATAAAVVFVPGETRAGVALGLNALVLAAISLTFRAQLIAVGLILLGVALLVVTWANESRKSAEESMGIEPKEPRPSAWVIGTIGLLLSLGLVGSLHLSDAPGRAGLGEPIAVGNLPSLHALATTLFDRYGLGVIGAALAALVLWVGVHSRRGGD